MKHSSKNETILARLLEKATNECADPDVRDKAYILWRAISSDQGQCEQLTNLARPPFQQDSLTFHPEDLDILLKNLGRVSSTYHQLPNEHFKDFFQLQVLRKGEQEREEKEIVVTKDIILQNPYCPQEEEKEQTEHDFDLLDIDFNQQPVVNLENLLDDPPLQEHKKDHPNQQYDFFDSLS